jgi:hypothetical protein
LGLVDGMRFIQEVVQEPEIGLKVTSHVRVLDRRSNNFLHLEAVPF